MIPIVRSWPKEPYDERRPHVIDDIEKMYMSDFDYRAPLLDLGKDVIVLEWDIAVSREDLLLFLNICEEAPDRVHVAPYKIYGMFAVGGSSWVHRVVVGDDWQTSPWLPAWRSKTAESYSRWVEPTDQFCHYFGFGMIYLPFTLVEMFCKERPESKLIDGEFSEWHFRNSDVVSEVPIHWDIRPVHLHYPMDKD